MTFRGASWHQHLELSGSLATSSRQRLIRAPLARPRHRVGQPCDVGSPCPRADALGPVDVAGPRIRSASPTRLASLSVPRWDPARRPLITRCPLPDDPVARQRQHRVESLIDQLPDRLRTITRWLRRPTSRWIRIPAGLPLVGGSLLIIPVIWGVDAAARTDAVGRGCTSVAASARPPPRMARAAPAQLVHG